MLKRFQGLQGFKDFLLRGNVVELAVAVVIGAAFTAVVNAFAADFLTPLIGLVGGGGRFGGQFEIAGQAFRWGAFISQVISFVLTAAVVYFLIVLPMHTIMERRRRGEEPGPVQPTQIELLVEIRDLLRAQQAGPALAPGGATGPAPAAVAPVGQRPAAPVPNGHQPWRPEASRPVGQPPVTMPPVAPSPVRHAPVGPPPAAPPPAAPPPGRPLPPVPPRRRD